MLIWLKKAKHYNLKNIKTFESIYKNKKKTNIKFGDIGIDNLTFHQYRKPISIKNIDINKIVVSNKVYFGNKDFKYFIVLKMLKNYPYFLQKRVHIEKGFGETKHMSSLIKDD